MIQTKNHGLSSLIFDDYAAKDILSMIQTNEISAVPSTDYDYTDDANMMRIRVKIPLPVKFHSILNCEHE